MFKSLLGGCCGARELYQCPECGKTYLKNRHLKGHIAEAHPEPVKIDALDAVDDDIRHVEGVVLQKVDDVALQASKEPDIIVPEAEVKVEGKFSDFTSGLTDILDGDQDKDKDKGHHSDRDRGHSGGDHSSGGGGLGGLAGGLLDKFSGGGGDDKHDNRHDDKQRDHDKGGGGGLGGLGGLLSGGGGSGGGGGGSGIGGLISGLVSGGGKSKGGGGGNLVSSLLSAVTSGGGGGSGGGVLGKLKGLLGGGSSGGGSGGILGSLLGGGGGGGGLAGLILKGLLSNMMPGHKRSYHKGWTPSTSHNKPFRPTVRDTGKGSAMHSDYLPRKLDDLPSTYAQVRDETIESGELWEDPDFPACDESMFFKDPPSGYPDIEWKRPHELCDDPQMFIGGATRMDVNQGVLGDCWFLAAVAGLATEERLLHRVVPQDQGFEEGQYAGVFHFQFWQYGRWVEVLVDDRLPTHYGKLIYMHSDDRNEFWSALIEKAYAKLNGSYESLSGGLTSEAMTDFTGGVVERFELRDKAPEDMFMTMLKAKQRFSLMGCSIDASRDEMEGKLDNGLIIGHAYSITGVRTTPTNLVRVRNPWGDEHEWKGPWGDESDEWNGLSDDERQEMGLSFEFDGEFWMSFEDWNENFQRLEICYLGPDAVLDDDESELADECRSWEGTLHEGSWRKRVNAGGCRNYPATFWTNPQYKIHVEEPDDDDEDGMQCVIISLMQKERRKLRSVGGDNLTMGYAIYELPDPDCGNLTRRYFDSTPAFARSKAFINMRELCDHHKLPPGDYCVVPSTFEPEEQGDFIVRVMSQKKDEVKELDDTTAITDPIGEDLPEDDDDDVAHTDEARESFNNLAGDDGELSAYELKDILNAIFQKEFEFDGFSIDMTRSMVAMKDADLSGKLGFDDFQDLWEDLKMCKKAFKTLDEDGNGYFNSYEFRTVLNQLGLKVSNATFNAIVMRYSNQDGHVRFDDFVACYIKLKTMFETFRDNDLDESGKADFEVDEFVQMTMYS